MKIAVLTSPNQWFDDYAHQLAKKIEGAYVYNEHEVISESYDVLFILSYHKIIPSSFLAKHKHNIVVHESDLPEGKGWAPLFWQVLEGKNEIIFSMFEASDGVDNGDVYLQEMLVLTGFELNEELRRKQAELTIKMCLQFIDHYETYRKPSPQQGNESFYQRRTAKDSELDIERSIKEQFNLLRIVNNESYPAFFTIKGRKYSIKIEEMGSE